MASATISTQGKALYAWTGSEWIPINAQNNVVNSLRWQKTLSASTSVLSGEDDNGNELYYSPGYEQVYLNGILLVKDLDYTATDGLTITDLDPISASSNVEVIAPKAITLANVYTKPQTDALINNIDLSPYLTIESASATYEPDIPYTSASPVYPAAGTLWVDSTNNDKPTLKVYNGIEWIAVSGATSESGFHPFFGAYK